jgi:hypothetical protein
MAYFYLEAFRFSEFFMTFAKALINSFITIVLILSGHYLFGRHPGTKHEYSAR